MEIPDWHAIELLLTEMIVLQQQKVYLFAQRIVPNITEEDLLQPNDYIELEHHAIFRYEEGVLEGLLSAQMALRAKSREN